MKKSTEKWKKETTDTFYEICKNRTQDVVGWENLLDKIDAGKKLTIKFGADPSKPDLHLGHSVVLRILRRFQDLGHKVVFVIGDYTAMIGDPSGKSKTRPQLSFEEVKKNAETYFDQAGKILDIKKAEIRYNSEWFSKMSFKDVLELASKFTVARILERDDFTKRLKEGTEIGVHEMLYPVMQAYDSVVLKADLEIGGTDQMFNMLAGRELQKKLGQTPQDVITVRILVGLDGKEKMSKSLDNYIALTDDAKVMYAKVMSIRDEAMLDYYELLTDVSESELLDVKETIKAGIKNPKAIKEPLAKKIAAMYHGEKKAEEAAREFEKVFSKKEVPDDVQEHILNESAVKLTDLLTDAGLAPSKAQARRLIEQGAVDIDGKTVSEWKNEIRLKDGAVIKCGKRQFVKISLKK